MAWISSGQVTNPVAGTVLCDSGALSAGAHEAVTILGATVACAVELQHRDAANAVTLHSQALGVGAFGTAQLPKITQQLVAGERLRVVAVTSPVGVVSVSLDLV